MARGRCQRRAAAMSPYLTACVSWRQQVDPRRGDILLNAGGGPAPAKRTPAAGEPRFPSRRSEQRRYCADFAPNPPHATPSDQPSGANKSRKSRHAGADAAAGRRTCADATARLHDESAAKALASRPPGSRAASLALGGAARPSVRRHIFLPSGPNCLR